MLPVTTARCQRIVPFPISHGGRKSGSIARGVIELPQPRDSSIIASDRFGRLVAQVWGALREESIKSFKQIEQRI